MKFLGLCVIALGILLGNPNTACADGGMPFPLGGKAPLPWSKMDGYWTDWNGQKYFYRIEVLEVYKDGSRTVSVALLNEATSTVLGSGLGFVRANSKDLWARVIGSEMDVKFRLQSFYPKNSTDLTKRALVASLQDMRADNTPIVKHMLVKVDSLEGRAVQVPALKKSKR